MDMIRRHLLDFKSIKVLILKPFSMEDVVFDEDHQLACRPDHLRSRRQKGEHRYRLAVGNGQRRLDGDVNVKVFGLWYWQMKTNSLGGNNGRAKNGQDQQYQVKDESGC
ncbi:hypothetical protein PSPO01_09087 [Paraphaeosphaeria sporulosa]